jgi:hypothetical protein
MSTAMPNSLFPGAPIPIEAQIACVERELGFRHRVYERRVKDGKMTQAKADSEIEAMTAVLETLRNLNRTPPPPMPAKPF